MINGLSYMITLLALDHSDLQEHYGQRVSHEGSLAKKKTLPHQPLLQMATAEYQESTSSASNFQPYSSKRS